MKPLGMEALTFIGSIANGIVLLGVSGALMALPAWLGGGVLPRGRARALSQLALWIWFTSWFALSALRAGVVFIP